MGSIRGYEKAEDSVHPEYYRDSWYRTFVGMPKFTDAEKDMIDGFVKDGEYTKLAIYLTEPRFGYDFDSDMAEFVIRELARNV